jgi:phenylacetate-CoA ligase
MPIEDRIYPLLQYYVGAPQFLKNLMGGAYALLPAHWRYGRRYNDFLEEVQHSADTSWLQQRAEEKLRETLLWAAQTVPAYADLRGALQDGQNAREWLSAFPLLPKDHIKSNPEQYLSREMGPKTHLLTHTGGSMSVPMRLYLHKYVSRSKDFAYNGAFDRVAGIGPHDTILAMRGRNVPGSDKPGGPIWLVDPIKRYLQVSSNHLEPKHMPVYLEAMRRHKPTFIHAYPSALEPLARWLEANPAPDVTRRIRCVQLFSESIYDYQIELIERVFACPVILDYGHSERAVKAISMPGDRRYFFWPLYGHVELVDLDGKPITLPGVMGEIVATGFDNKVMPLIRYRTGDMAMWSTRPNTLRPGFAVVDRIEGRLQEFLVTSDQRLVSIASVCGSHFEVLVNADCMQFEQTQPGQAQLKIVSPHTLSSDVMSAIKQGMLDKTGGGLTVEPIQVERIARTVSGKHMVLVQRLNIASVAGQKRSLPG